MKLLRYVRYVLIGIGLLIIQFPSFADPNLFHCHILEHEDMGMMGQYVVVNSLSDQVHLTPLPKEANAQMYQ